MNQEQLISGVLNGSAMQRRRAISKAITLLESSRADHRIAADALLTALLPHTGRALRLGLSGVPGVGKSTFIEALGLHLIDQGLRVAVLAIDPSSTISGGSILGDKTRMERLCVQENAYIRPSPSGGTLGGVAEKTREAMLVCEAAGFDVVIVETVGVGQSETTAHGMTDMFVVLQLPNAGDDLQAIKKGVMEMADLVVINKADIDPVAAGRAQAQITSSLRLQRYTEAMPRASAAGGDKHHQEGSKDADGADPWQPKVLQMSALHNQGIATFWQAVEQYRHIQSANGQITQRRQQQNLYWMWERVDAGLRHMFHQSVDVQTALPDIAQRVNSGRLAASTAARQLLHVFSHTTSKQQ